MYDGGDLSAGERVIALQTDSYLSVSYAHLLVKYCHATLTEVIDFLIFAAKFNKAKTSFASQIIRFILST